MSYYRIDMAWTDRMGEILSVCQSWTNNRNDYESYEVPRSLFEYRVRIVFTFYYNDCYIHM